MVLRWLWCSFPWLFWVGVVLLQVQQLACVDRVEGEIQPQQVALGLKQSGALLVELVDLDTTPGSRT